MPATRSLPSTDRRADSRQQVKINGHIRVVLTTREHAYVNEEAAIENLSSHGALVHLYQINGDHIIALGKPPQQCTMLFDQPYPGGLMFLAGDVVWAKVAEESGHSHAYLGVCLTGMEGRGQSRLNNLLGHPHTGS